MNENGLLGLILGLGGIFLVIVLALVILTIIAQWKLFKKAGKNGWEAIIPFYSTWVLIEIAGLNWWYFIISIMTSIEISIESQGLIWSLRIANYFINFLIYYNIAKKTKQNEILYGILGAIIPIVPVAIIGFSKNIVFDHSIKVSPNGIFGDNNLNNNFNTTNQSYVQERYCLGCGQKLNNNVRFCENCGKKVEDTNSQI